MHLLTQSAVLRALGWSLFDSFWQMAALWLLYNGFVCLFKGASANARHGLATLLLGTGAVWTAGSFAVNLLYPGRSGIAAWLGGFVITQEHPLINWLSLVREQIVGLLPWCSALYLLALSLLSVRYGIQYSHSRKLRTTGLSRIQPEYRLFVEQTAQLMSIPGKVSVWFSSLVEGPVTLGFLRPVILIPIATAGNLHPVQLEAILLHELAHIKGNDYLRNLAVAMLEILFFFNPFSRLLVRTIKREREHRCDDLVMQFRYDPHTYISALLSLAGGTPAHPRLALAATGGNDQLLLQRVRRILKMPTAQDRPALRPVLLILFTLCLTFTICLTRKPGSFSFARVAFASETPIAGHIFFLPATTAAVPETTPVIRQVDFKHVSAPAAIAAQPSPGPTPASHRAAHKDLARHAADNRDDEEDPGYTAAGDKYSSTAISYVSDFHPADDQREFSISISGSATGSPSPAPDVNTGNGLELVPFVPQTSFTCIAVQDSIRPDQQLAYLHKIAVNDVENAVKKMQKELQLQLHILTITKDLTLRGALQSRRQVLEEQLKLQEDYLHKQRELQLKLDRSAKKKPGKIVII